MVQRLGQTKEKGWKIKFSKKPALFMNSAPPLPQSWSPPNEQGRPRIEKSGFNAELS